MTSTPSTMRIVAALPQEATKGDPIAVRDFAQAVEQLGYAHLEVYDHVVGANRETYPNLTGPYRLEHAFYEPFVLFGYLAGQTRSIELVTGVIILSQRQTVLVAKQAAIVDVLSGGRLRLGVGTGWNRSSSKPLARPSTIGGGDQRSRLRYYGSSGPRKT